jgi:hypothetical protein
VDQYMWVDNLLVATTPPASAVMRRAGRPTHGTQQRLRGILSLPHAARAGGAGTVVRVLTPAGKVVWDPQDGPAAVRRLARGVYVVATGQAVHGILVMR